MIEGVLLLDRAMTRHKEWLLDKPFTSGQAWVDLLLLANQRRSSFKSQQRVVFVEPGQVGWSLMGLADRWGWSQGKVGRTLKRWEQQGMVQIETDGHHTLITVTNFVHYQTALVMQTENQRRTGSEPTENQQAANGEPTVTEGEGGKGLLNCTEEKGKGKGFQVLPGQGQNGATAVSANVAAITRNQQRAALEAAIADIRAKEKDDRDANLPMDMQRRSTLRSLEAQLRGLDA